MCPIDFQRAKEKAPRGDTANPEFFTNKNQNKFPMKKFNFITAIFIFTMLLNSSCKEDFAQWRGINRDGIYQETNLLDQWPENGPEEIWATEIVGTGYASPTVTNDKLFVNGEIDSMSYLFAFNLNGELLWKTPNGKEFFGNGFSATYPGARSAPTVVGDLVYSCSSLGRILCCEVATGKEVWAVEMVKDLGGYENMFGFSESLVVEDGKVYCFPGGVETNFAALDMHTGKPVWTSKALSDTNAYCSPITINLPEKKVLVMSTRHNLLTVDCSSGELLGSYPIVYKYDGEHCNTPIYQDGHIYFVTMDKGACGAVKLKLSDDGTQLTEIWRNEKVKNDFSGFMVLNNKFYTTIKGNWLKALDLETGQVVDSLQNAYGSIIYADNKFITYGRNGTVSLLSEKENKLVENSSFKVQKGNRQHFSHPVLAKGIMYIRHGKALMAYKIK